MTDATGAMVPQKSAATLHATTRLRRGALGRSPAGARAAAQRPLAGRVVPEFERTDIREVLPGNYRVVYRVRPKEIHVLTVFEAHRLLSAEDLTEPG